jgi:hypothetical protein
VKDVYAFVAIAAYIVLSALVSRDARISGKRWMLPAWVFVATPAFIVVFTAVVFPQAFTFCARAVQ